MEREIPYRIILPEKYEVSERKYPVIYLLHGLFGSCENWFDLTEIEKFSIGKDFVIVMPEGRNSWYCDSATIHRNKFESYIIDELILEIENKFKVLRCRENRAIAGLSMGGYGALKFGLKRPDLFYFVASMSGAFDAPNRSDTNEGHDWEILKSSLSEVFGNENSLTRKKNDLFCLVEKQSFDSVDSLPDIYIECGVNDGFLETNRKMVELLKNKRIRAEYREFSGGHDWQYWNRGIERILKIVSEKFQIKNSV